MAGTADTVQMLVRMLMEKEAELAIVKQNMKNTQSTAATEKKALMATVADRESQISELKQHVQIADNARENVKGDNEVLKRQLKEWRDWWRTEGRWLQKPASSWPHPTPPPKRSASQSPSELHLRLQRELAEAEARSKDSAARPS